MGVAVEEGGVDGRLVSRGIGEIKGGGAGILSWLEFGEGEGFGGVLEGIGRVNSGGGKGVAKVLLGIFKGVGLTVGAIGSKGEGRMLFGSKFKGRALRRGDIFSMAMVRLSF